MHISVGRMLVAAALLVGAAAPGEAACPETCVAGGGSPKTDCLVEFDGIAPNHPSSQPKRLRCQDGDPRCDTDGAVNGSCRFLVRVCANVVDPALARCVPSDVASFEIRNPAPGAAGHDPQLTALATALPLPTAEATCGDPVPLYVSLGGKRRLKARTRRVRTEATSSTGASDVDKLALSCVPSPRLPRRDAVYAFATEVSEPAQLIDGPLARGRAGDVLLANDRIQVVIQQPGRSMFGIGPYGGTIIDADRQRVAGEERDSFEELAPLVNVENTVNYTTVTVLHDGSDGAAAVVRATGPDDLLDYVNASTIVSDAGFAFPPSLDDRDLPLDVQTDYALEPGASAVRIETTLRNTGAAPLDLFFGDIMNGSGQVELFQEGYGFGEPLVTVPCDAATYATCGAGTCDPCNVIAWSGDESAAGVSYGYVHAVGGSTSFSVSGVTASLLGNQVLLVLVGLATPNLHLEAAGSAGDAATLVRWFVVGDGSVASVTDARNVLQAVVTGTLAGTVSADDDGDGSAEPLPNADVAVTVDATAPAEKTRVVTHVRTDAAGRYAAALAAGSYQVRVNRDGRHFAAAAVETVAIPTGVQVTHDVELPPPGRLEVRVEDESGAPIPAKVTLVGFDPSPDLDRVEDIAGAVHNVTHAFGDQGDPLPYGVAGVFFADRDGTTGLVEIEPGRYQVNVSRGTRYAHATQLVDVPEGGAGLTVTATLARVVDTAGFIAADFHLHALDSPDSEVSREARVASQLAEGIDFFTPSEHDIQVDFQPIVEAMGVGDLIATATGVEITTFDYGHFNTWPVTADPAQVNGGSVDWGRPGVAPGTDFPSLGSFGYSPAELFAAALADPAPNLVQVNHIDSFFGGAGLDIDTGLTPPQSHTTAASRRLDPALGNLFDAGFQALEVWNGNQGIFLGQNMGDWLNLMNQGIVRTAVATSDSHEKRTNSGGSRTFIASLETAPSQLAAAPGVLAEAIVSGRAIGTNGPFVTVRVDASSTGEAAGLALGLAQLARTTDGAVDVTIDVASPRWAEFDTIELYVNAQPQPYDHDGDPATRDRYRVPPDLVLANGTDFTRMEGSESYAAAVTVPLTGLTADAWVVVLVRGTPGVSRPLFPIVPGGLDPGANPTLDDLLDGNLGEGGDPALAFTNPVFMDVDGDGVWTPPGLAP